MDVLNPKEAAEYGSIEDDGVALDEEVNDGLLDTGVRTGVLEEERKWV